MDGWLARVDRRLGLPGVSGFDWADRSALVPGQLPGLPLSQYYLTFVVSFTLTVPRIRVRLD